MSSSNVNSGIEVNKTIVLVNSVSSAIVLVLKLTVLIWLQQYLLKRISAEEYSLIPIMMAMMAIPPLITMILTSGIGRYTTIAFAKNDHKQITKICSTMFPILVTLGIIIFIIGVILALKINIVLNVSMAQLKDARIMTVLLFFHISMQLILSIFSSGLLIRQKLVLENFIALACELFRIALLFFLLLYFKPRSLWVILSLISSGTLQLVISSIISYRLIPSQRVVRGYFDRNLLKELLNFGSHIFLSKFSEIIKKSLDPIILNKFSTATEVTMFHVGSLIPRQLENFLGPITRPLFPVFSSLYANHENERLSNVYLRSARYHSWVLVFFSIPIIIYSNELMSLYLDELYPGVGNILILLLSVEVLRRFHSFGQYVAGVTGYAKELSTRTIIVQAINLVCTVVFVVFLKKGAFGSAFASLLSVLPFEMIILWPLYNKVSYVSFRTWVRNAVVPVVLPALPSIIFCIIMKRILSINTWLLLFTICVISGILYVIFILLFGITKQDRNDLHMFVKKIKTILKGRKKK